MAFGKSIRTFKNSTPSQTTAFETMTAAQVNSPQVQNTNQPLPSRYIDTMFPPGWPIRPFTSDKDRELPREINYPISVNVSLVPRTQYGLQSFDVLAQAYQNITEVRLPIRSIMRTLSSFRPRFLDKDGDEVDDHDLMWLLEAPDRETPWVAWLMRFLQSTLIFDAAALHIQEQNRSLAALRYVQGDTLFVWVDQYGHMPAAQPLKDQYGNVMRDKETGKPYIAPAFTQIILGTPYSWWTQDEIVYRPRFRAYNAPYGTSPIEDCWAEVIWVSNIKSFEIAHYREGNMPEGIFTPDKESNMTLVQLATMENTYNARLVNNLSERNRIRFFPPGFKYQETKRPDFPEKAYKQANENIKAAFGYPAARGGGGGMPGGGLGGKGFGDWMQDVEYREVNKPMSDFVAASLNEVLGKFDVDDVTFDLVMESEGTDPDKEKAAITDQMTHGIITWNQGLSDLGLDPVEEDWGEWHLIVTDTGTVIALEDVLGSDIRRPDGITGGGAPIPPAALTPDPNAEPNPDANDKKREQAARMIASGTVTGKNTKVFDMHKDSDYPVNNHTLASLDTQGIDIDELLMGLKEEQEHAATVDYDQSVIAQLVLDHLREDPHYYSHLLDTQKAQIEKRYKVEPRNGKYVVVNIDTGKDVPGGEHDTKAEADAHARALYANVPDAHKNLDTIVIQPIFMNKYEMNGIRVSSSRRQPSERVGKSYQRHVIYKGKVRDVHYPDPLLEKRYGDPKKKVDPFAPGFWIAYDNLHPEEAAVERFAEDQLKKHCGVCEDDDIYYGAPLASPDKIQFPITWHANDVQIVAMMPDGYEPRPALWKPAGGELDTLVSRIGGPQYLREEAAYLLDRSLKFYLVPVAYVGEVTYDSGTIERGAAVHYVRGNEPAQDVKEYTLDWVLKAGVLDYIMLNTDRHYGNWLTHPEENDRPILIDNGLSFPVTAYTCWSPFVDAVEGVDLPDDILGACMRCDGDMATWQEIKRLVGDEAAQQARARLASIIQLKKVLLQLADESETGQ